MSDQTLPRYKILIWTKRKIPDKRWEEVKITKKLESKERERETGRKLVIKRKKKTHESFFAGRFQRGTLNIHQFSIGSLSSPPWPQAALSIPFSSFEPSCGDIRKSPVTPYICQLNSHILINRQKIIYLNYTGLNLSLLILIINKWIF